MFSSWDDRGSYIANAEKIGFKTQFMAEHPFLVGKKIPVYVANFILMDYGTGAIFGCPAHDQRDYDFAKKYKLEIIDVVKPKNDGDKVKNVAFTGDGTIINSDFLNKLSITEAKNKIVNEIEKRKIGKKEFPSVKRLGEFLVKDIGDVLYL